MSLVEIPRWVEKARAERFETSVQAGGLGGCRRLSEPERQLEHREGEEWLEHMEGRRWTLEFDGWQEPAETNDPYTYLRRIKSALVRKGQVPQNRTHICQSCFFGTG